MSKIAHVRGWSAFSTLCWSAFLVVALYLFAWPVIEGYIVQRTWTAIPAFLPRKEDNVRYFFTFKGTNYLSPRFNLWQVHNMYPVVTRPDTPHEPNATCYIREGPAGTVIMAVMYPHVTPDFALVVDRIALAALVGAAALVMDWKTRRTRKKARTSAAGSPS